MLLKKSDLVKIFSISWLQALVYFLISLATFIFFSWQTLTDKIFNQSVLSNDAAKEAVMAQVKSLGTSRVVSILAIVLFWSAIGLVVYTIIWIAMIILTEARNQVVVETDYVNRGSLKDRIQGPVLQIIVFIGLLLFIALSLTVLYPQIWISSFNQFLLAFPADLQTSLGYGVVAFVGSMINIYLVRALVVTIFALE